jgi:hypothetical protein
MYWWLNLQACELEPESVELLMQRAHLYEGSEKYKLGMADLREVLKMFYKCELIYFASSCIKVVLILRSKNMVD